MNFAKNEQCRDKSRLIKNFTLIICGFNYGSFCNASPELTSAVEPFHQTRASRRRRTDSRDRNRADIGLCGRSHFLASPQDICHTGGCSGQTVHNPARGRGFNEKNKT